MSRFVALLALSLATGFPSIAFADAVETSTDLTIDEVIACMAANSPEEALVQVVELVTVDRAGSERKQTGKLAMKRFPIIV